MFALDIKRAVIHIRFNQLRYDTTVAFARRHNECCKASTIPMVFYIGTVCDEHIDYDFMSSIRSSL